MKDSEVVMKDKSRSALIGFLDYLATKGLMAKATVSARKAAVAQVLGVLSDQEAEDVLSVDIPDVMARFQNLQGKRYTPGSLTTYQSRLRAALEDFESYLDNPLGFRPRTQIREKVARSAAKKSDKAEGGGDEASEPVARRPKSVADTILPIPIRPDLTVHVQGLPYDLTETEARKIANVIIAMTNSTS